MKQLTNSKQLHLFLRPARRLVNSQHQCTQGRILSRLLYTHVCTAKFCSNSLSKFADDHIALGQISNEDETEYRKEIECSAALCKDNNLSLKFSRSREPISEMKRPGVQVCTNGSEVQMVESFKCFGVNIVTICSGPITDATAKKAHQCLYFRRTLRSFDMSPTTLTSHAP